MVRVILLEYKIMNADVICRGDYTVDDLIDILEGNRKYINCIFVYNKIDLISIEDVDEVSRRPHSCAISVNMQLGFERLLRMIWDELGLIRIYTKKRGDEPNFNEPIILTNKREGNTVETVCRLVHKDFVS